MFEPSSSYRESVIAWVQQLALFTACAAETLESSSGDSGMQKVSCLALLPTQVLKLLPEQQPRPSRSPVLHPSPVPA